MKFYSDQFYVKSAEEMYALWTDLPEACDNTVEIAKRIDIKIPEKIFHLPHYPVPEEITQPERTTESYLREICEAGLIERYGAERAQTTRRCARGSITNSTSSTRWASRRTS